MNIVKLVMYYTLDCGLEMADCINREAEESYVKFRTNYQPGDINSATIAIDNIINSIYQKREELRIQSEKFGFRYQTGRIELIITREDGTTIASLTINNEEELEISKKVYDFLRNNFYYI